MLVLQYRVGVCAVKINPKTGTCKICGKEYQMYKYTDNGGIAGVRTMYCSEACAHVVKKARDKERFSKRQKKLEQTIQPRDAVQIQTQSYGNTRTNIYYMQYYMGPLAGLQCFGCPFIGEECRNMIYPMCRPMNPRHNEYLRVVRECQDRYYFV